MRDSEIRSLGAIAGGSVAQPSLTARDVHSAIARRVFGALGPLGIPARAVHDRVSRAAYHATSTVLREPLRAAGRALAATAPAEAPPLADSTTGSLALGALNGIAGDRIAREQPALALELGFRHRGRELELEPEALAAAFPTPSPRLAVFVHGLCETDEAWWLGAGKSWRSYGDRLADELSYTPLYLRYNTGLHVSDNGRDLAAAIATLCERWPEEVEGIALVGHSMGGLVSRSACHYGAADGHAWAERLRHVVCLGTPHLGAPLERAANVAGSAFNRLPETRPFGDLFLNGRSAGIKDLRFGSCVEEDWCDNDPDEFLRDRCNEVPFLESVTYCFVGATLSRRPDGIGGMVGDLLVHYRSASGEGRRRRIGFEPDNGRHLPGAHHLQLLNHPAVYEHLREWLAREPAELTAPA